eukprot:TRINITY_DN30968_c0_g1_i1.p1 TRINITY_DN30968_c0_g1~~TRINITY_DN30968_c0_g1_i1.p1  ORF type:complete len:172 (+),score=17.08 TRINITY_DN30968_c0_g1_i1:86-601(+)
MSRNAYGDVWHQSHCRPNHTGNNTGEEYPKRAPSPGHHVFRGVPNDFPSEKVKWYTGEGMDSSFAGTSTLWKDYRKGPGFQSKFSTGSQSVPDLMATQREKRESRRQALAPQGPEVYGHAGTCRSLPKFENSHSMLVHGRDQRQPQLLQHAGVSTFAMRRYHMTNTSMPGF